MYPLHRAFGLKRFIASTYQAVSGAGVQGLKAFQSQLDSFTTNHEFKVFQNKKDFNPVFPYPILNNLFPHVGNFLPNGESSEERKMLEESQKILDLPKLLVSTTCVRVPIQRAHSIALNAEFENPVSVQLARKALKGFENIELNDFPSKNLYPMPKDYSLKQSCGVGRVRLDPVFNNGLALWAVGDQLIKGAALNGLQIAEYLLR